MNAADAARPATQPVSSLEPEKTALEWRQVVTGQRVQGLRADECRPIRLVFYAATDWLRLATKLAATASPCAQYYVSVPPLAADKTQSRADQAWRIRALGPNIHALAEVNMNAWAGWVTSTGGSWYGAGVEARRRLAAAGYDVAAGDLWAVNEFSSAVRRGDGSARANARDFVRGLHDGDGTAPVAKGVVFIAGMSQATTNLSVYQQNLQAWLTDSAFWEDMARYVRDWSQEQYADVRNVAVPGADLFTRRDALVDYLDHELVLARVGPAETAAARAFLEAASSPVANAAWQWESAFGWTNVDAELMKHFVSTQVYALRHFRATALPAGVTGTAGFAWAPRNATAASDFTAKSGEILERLAAAIRDSGYDASPGDPAAGACASVWCAGDQPDGWLNRGWQSFRAWQTPPPPADTTPPETSIASGPAPSVTATSAVFEFSASESGSVFECRLDGAAYAPCTSPKSYSELAAGSHTFEVRAVDAAGNVDATAAARTWTVVASRTSGDFDGDGDADIGFYRPSNGVWVIRGQEWVHFPGLADDVALPADYDGDGDTDIAFYRPSTGVWVIRGQEWVHFPASPGDVLLPADYDGDGDADLAFYRPSAGVWVIRGQPWVHFPAQPDDVLLPADYDGDGDTDLAFYRPSTGLWAIRGQEWVSFAGLADDVPTMLPPWRRSFASAVASGR